MDGRCPAGQYWDALLKNCISCDQICKQKHIISRCTSHCESASCKALPGHYYDLLLKKCVRCAKVCGRHPAECSQLCHTPSPPVTTNTLLVEVTSHVQNPRDSTVLLYSLLALCMMLLLSSLSLAFAVLLRGARAKSFNRGAKEANQHQESVGQRGQEVGRPGKSSEEPSYDSSPTETCVCVYCFPDLKALGHGNNKPLREPLYQQPDLQRAQIEKRGPVWTVEDLYTSGLQVQEETAVG
ncbi:tumor necrosis factor receptor superfamily member 13B [Cottoperca gobio]|uniref:Tumor necrosis factor receptor superfamily member 13B n=1 Tax=Cottoperca gobio TaxID=56716 RepID=A0A6J2RSI9_COTGO|nr:tumor necrosis factor receptor superfamily member 13B [Cottoperca gobio]